MITIMYGKHKYEVTVHEFDHLTVAIVRGAAFAESAVTLCHPKDEFSPERGVKVSLHRLSGEIAEEFQKKFSRFRKLRYSHVRRMIYSAMRRILKDDPLCKADSTLVIINPSEVKLEDVL